MTAPEDASPPFLSVDEVLLLHQLCIQEFGGKPGLRDLGLLETAGQQTAD
jgi:hypothetical protein